MRVQGFEDRGHRGCCGDGFRSALSLEQAIFRGEPLGLLQGTMQFNLRTRNRRQVCSSSHRFWMKSRGPTPHGFDGEFDVAPCGHGNDRQRALLRKGL